MVSMIDPAAQLRRDRALQRARSTPATRLPSVAPGRAVDDLLRYLQGTKTMTPEELKKARKMRWERLFREEGLDDEDLLPLRTAVAWRIVRRMASFKGLVLPDQTLEEGLRVNPSPWTSPVGLIQGAPPRQDSREQMILELITDPPLPLLPPSIPPDAPEKYDCRKVSHDPDLHNYLTALVRIAVLLDIPAAAPDNPGIGRLGLKGITNKLTIRELFPPQEMILAYEIYLVKEALQLHSEKGVLGAVKGLYSRYGLQSYEAIEVLRIAQAMAKQLNPIVDLEQCRALMDLALDDFLVRARESLDLTAEMQGLKLKSQIQGLNRSEPVDDASDFTAIIQRVAKNAERKRLKESNDEG